jgi:23S rRNA (uracil1939-C5)-methyltransferase
MRLIGIELHPSSIERARCNALLNGMDNAEFKVGSMERSLEEVLPFTDALLLDPPRKGLSERLCDAIAAEPPARIAYVSCNPSTLARDLARLTAKGSLELQSVHPLDFFPQTTHTEAMAVLVRPGAQR